MNAYLLRMRAGCAGGGKGPLIQEEVSGTLATTNEQTLFQPVGFAANQRGEVRLQGGDGDVTGAVPANMSGKQINGVAQDYIVRRLTPRECERLQGFPEWIEIEVDDTTPSDEVAAIALANGDIIVDFDTGKVYGTRGPGGMKLENPRELGTKHPSGYIHIHLSAGGQKRQVRAHRIVWMAANGAIPDGMVIDHINNVKSDNRLSNLQLMTPEDNSHKAKDDGLYLSGDASPTCKLTADVRTRLIYDRMAYGMTYSELAQKYGVTRSHACQIVKASDHTKIPYRGKPADECPDTPRYKAIGNSMCVNVMRWIGERIQKVDDEIRTAQR